MLAVILGGSLSVHASAHDEYDWAIFFFLLGLLNGAMALVTARVVDNLRFQVNARLTEPKCVWHLS